MSGGGRQGRQGPEALTEHRLVVQALEAIRTRMFDSARKVGEPILSAYALEIGQAIRLLTPISVATCTCGGTWEHKDTCLVSILRDEHAEVTS